LCRHHCDLHSFPTRRSSDLLLALAAVGKQEFQRRAKNIGDKAPARSPQCPSPPVTIVVASISFPRRVRCPLSAPAATGRCGPPPDRKSTRLNSSHLVISYAV